MARNPDAYPVVFDSVVELKIIFKVLANSAKVISFDFGFF